MVQYLASFTFLFYPFFINSNNHSSIYQSFLIFIEFFEYYLFDFSSATTPPNDDID